MKVLHVIPSLWPGDGGPAEALISMESALRAQGVEVETVTTDDDGRGRRAQVQLGRPQVVGGATHRYFAKWTDFYKFSPGLARWLFAHAGDYDLLHLHALFTFSTVAGAHAARHHGVPYVVRPLGTLDAWSVAHRRPLLKRLSLRLVESRLLRDAAAVHFTSEAEAHQAGALGLALRGVVIPLAVHMPPAPSRARERQPQVRILYLSRLTPKKNVEGLLDAFARVVAAHPQVQLAIAGDGEPAYVAHLRGRAQALGVDQRVEWLGRVEGDAKERAFAAADIFALPSHSENFGIAAAEALARGVPCLLGAGVAIAPDVSAAGAGVVTGTDASEIARALELMIDAKARQAMSARALQLARERFSPEAMGARIKAMYTEILAGRHGLPAKH